MLKIALRPAHAVLFKQLHHQGKNGRLGAAEIVGTVAVRDMAVALNQPGEVIGHTFQQIVTTAFSKPQHGEVRVPVVGLTESPAGHNIGLRQRQQRRPRDVILRFARQHRPQIINMFFQGQAGVRDVLFAVVLRQPEVILHKARQVKITVTTHLAIADQNIQRIHLRRAVGKGFAVRKQPRRLDVFKQFKVAVCGRKGIGRRQSFNHFRFRLCLDHLIQF